ncbi:arginase family-domain-containing protein [Suillus bovinus]|uniref:arginase family-domain-containing protein n=1 Tax=Suillus bovinus TaxID=48563 RepID=UPI001B86181A|nr:arginase family-domain-containing protein [Suillus bovinus]KAG2159614.1 arginase family-domain-containing protein [Suillus bovinus]
MRYLPLALLPVVFAQQHAFETTQQEPWTTKYGRQTDLSYTGPLSFSHLPYTRCLDDLSTNFDIAVLGMPFDTATSYRPGARFGPYAIRSGSRRQSSAGGYSMEWMTNPYTRAEMIDCGDVPINPYDNALAIDQMETAYTTLLARPVNGSASARTAKLARDGVEHPRILTLGGDHTIVLPILRSLYQVYGPISVIHFDAHIDTWPSGGGFTTQSRVNHGTFFTWAFEEGLMSNTSIHAGIRTRMEGPELIEHDEKVGFELIMTDDIDDIGANEIIKHIRQRVGNSPVYLSFDIDTIDPGQAPATGTPEPAGWTSRETKRILRGLAGLNFVGADIVEVAPAYDNAGEITGMLAANLATDFLALMVTDEPPKRQIKRRRTLADEL